MSRAASASVINGGAGMEQASGDQMVDLSSICRGLVGLARKGLIVRLGGARKRMLAAKRQLYDAQRKHTEELAARQAKQLWRRAQRERQRAEFFWRETRKERRRAEAAWRRVLTLTGVDPAAPMVGISVADRDRLAKILGMLGSDQPGEVASAARHAEAIRGKLGVSWDELLAAAGPSVAWRNV
jgi:hypothetical protein